jgi:hypothetical protein
MIHYQHKGPFGRYHPPKDSRFQFDNETNRVVSLVPGIEIVDQRVSGRPGEQSRRTLVRIGLKYYSFIAEFDVLRNEEGNQVFCDIDGNGKPDGVCWYRVSGKDVWLNDDGIQPIVDFEFKDIHGFVENVLMEIMSVDAKIEVLKHAKRVIFDDSQSIAPKNWEIIRDE